MRTLGTEDLHLVWVHDAPERLGVSIYMDTAQPGDSNPHIGVPVAVEPKMHFSHTHMRRHAIKQLRFVSMNRKICRNDG